MLRNALSWKNAWQIRIVALGFIVLLVGISSQLLVNALAATTSTMTIKVTASTTIGRMADGRWTYNGACTVPTTQFSLGTIIALYSSDGAFVRQCKAEDTNSTLGNGHIELVMPGDSFEASRWGTRYLTMEIVRDGWGTDGPPPPDFASSMAPIITASNTSNKPHPLHYKKSH